MATLEEFKKSRSLRTVRAAVTYADTTATRIFTLPRGARILYWVINVTTQFSGGTTTLSIGISGTATHFINAQSVAATGTFIPDTEATAAQAGHTTTAQTDVYVTVGGSNSQGAATIECVFALDVERGITQ